MASSSAIFQKLVRNYARVEIAEFSRIVNQKNTPALFSNDAGTLIYSITPAVNGGKRYQVTCWDRFGPISDSKHDSLREIYEHYSNGFEFKRASTEKQFNALIAHALREMDRKEATPQRSVRFKADYTNRQSSLLDPVFPVGKERSAAPVGTIGRADLESVVNRVIEGWQSHNRRNDIIVIPSFNYLPLSIREVARERGAIGLKGAYYDGIVYLVQDQIADEFEAERVLMHESLHYGLDLFYKGQAGRMLDGLYWAMGGLDGIRKVARKYGINLSGYEQSSAVAVQAGDMSREKRHQLILEEMLAHLAEDNTPGLRRWVKELVGCIRDNLRKAGFLKSSKVKESELFYLLKRCRQAVVRGRSGESFEQQPAFAIQRQWYRSSLSDTISGLKKVADKLGRVKATVARQWLEAQQKRGAFRAMEAEAVGLYDWLDTLEGKTGIEDIQLFVDSNGVRLEETVYAEPAFTKAEVELFQQHGYTLDVDGFEGFGEDIEFNGLYDSDGDQVEFADLPDELKSIMDAKSCGLARYQKHKLKGGSNYREFVLRTPNTRAPAFDSSLLEISRTRYSATQGHVDLRYNGKLLIAGLNDNYQIAEHKLIERAKRIYEDGIYRPDGKVEQEGRVTRYRSPHWKERDVVVHIRTTDRQDLSGGKTLFVEEIQSDWGQEGLRNGFRGEPLQYGSTIKGYTPMGHSWNKRVDPKLTYVVHQLVRDSDGAVVGEGSDRTVALTNSGLNPEINPGPFVTNTGAWVRLAIKRVVAFAAENGYDSLAFVGGHQAALTQGLARYIDALYYDQNEDGTYRLTLVKNGSTYRDDSGAFSSIAAEDLPAYVGKSVAEQIVKEKGDLLAELGFLDISDPKNPVPSTGRRLNGLAMRVGGIGVTSFYDNIVPKEAARVLKGLGGGSIQDIAIQLHESEWPYSVEINSDDKGYWLEGQHPDYESGESRRLEDRVYPDYDTAVIAREQFYAGHRQQPGIVINDEIRARVREGLPLFMVAYHGTPKEFDRFILGFIGTGEGAQAYGWGLYFSDCREVAEHYKKTVTFYQNPDNWETEELEDGWYVTDPNNEVQYIGHNEADADEWIARNTGEMAGDGNLYQVEIAEEDQLLNWDVPLYEQPPGVIEKLRGDPIFDRYITYRPVEKSGVDYWRPEDDQGNETPGGFTCEGRQEALETLAKEFGGEGFYKALTYKLGSPEAASKYLDLRGIPGLCYKDSYSTLYTFEPPTRNYVIWDENVVSIEAVNNPTATPEFKNWFGQSKVLDSNSKPLVVYHGGQKLDAWGKQYAGVYGAHAEPVKNTYGDALTAREIDSLNNPIFFFTDDERIAEGYADQGEGYEVRASYLKIENPLDVRDNYGLAAGFLGLPAEELKAMSARQFSQTLRWEWTEVGKKVKAAGYDGIIFTDTDVLDRGEHTAYAVFESRQIKSVHNTGSFDPYNPHIMFKTDGFNTEAKSTRPSGLMLSAEGYKADPTTIRLGEGVAPEYLVREWMDRAGLTKEQVDALAHTGHLQQGDPEKLMLRATMLIGGGVMNPVLEHLGDIINRLSPLHPMDWARNEAVTKTLLCLRYLQHGYGFEREHQENLKANAEVYNKPLDEYQAQVRQALKAYAEAHLNLPVYNNIQRMGREAAVCLGEGDYKNTIFWLEKLESKINTPEKFAAELQSTSLTYESDLRIAASKGFNTARVWYHRSNQAFDEFDPTNKAHWFTDTGNISDVEGEHVYHSYLRVKKPYSWQQGDPEPDNPEFIKQLKAKGYDGVMAPTNVGIYADMVVFDAKDIMLLGRRAVQHAEKPEKAPELSQAPDPAPMFSASAYSKHPLKELDLSFAARMARAKEQGFDTETVWYHGSGNSFDEFGLDCYGRGRPFVFLTTHPEVAAQFAQEQADGIAYEPDEISGGAVVYPLLVRREKTFDPDCKDLKENRAFERELMRQMNAFNQDVNEINTLMGKVRKGDWIEIEENPAVQATLKALGYDSFYVYEQDYTSGRGVEKNLAVYNPVNISSVNAAFSPEFGEAADLMFMAAAYHGTPYEFDRFSLGFIGTGEGAQAYGWGLYFAGRCEVAQYYRDALSRDPCPVVKINGRSNVAEMVSCQVEKALGFYKKDAISQEELISFLDKKIDEASGPYAGRVIKELKAVRKTISKAKTFEAAYNRHTEGSLYQVEIPEDSEYLDWDADINQQSKLEKLRPALDQLQIQLEGGDKRKAMKGSELYMAINLAFYMRRSWTTDWARANGYTPDSAEYSAINTEELAARYLGTLGIPGVRYLDHYSRYCNGELLGVWQGDALKMEDTGKGKWFARIKNGDNLITSMPVSSPELAQDWADKLITSQPTYNYVIWDEGVIGTKKASASQPKPSFMATAYHGSPHEWGNEKPSLTRVGSGEGNNAFGWGLYFAESKGVAEFYKNALTSQDVESIKLSVGGQRWPLWYANLSPEDADRVWPAVAQIQDAVQDVRDEWYAFGRFTNPLDRARGWAEEALTCPEKKEGAEQILDALDAYPFEITGIKQGYVYKVEVPDDNSLLDWDAPFHEQPPRVAKALRTVVAGLTRLPRIDVVSLEDSTGEALYHAIATRLGSKESASTLLLSHGIPGLRYLDGVCRKKGEGTRNYVVWDDTLITTTEINEVPVFGTDEDRKKTAEAERALPVMGVA